MQTIVEVPAFHIFRSSNETLSSNAGQPPCFVEATAHTPEIENYLWQAYQWKDDVTIRCVALDACGSIENVRYDGGGRKIFTLRVNGFSCRDQGR